jgi:hypothetical protein
VKLWCGGPGGGAGGLGLEGRIYLRDGVLTGGEIHHAAPGEARTGLNGLDDLEVVGGSLRRTGNAWSCTLDVARKGSGLHARTAGGDAVESIALSWRDDGSASDLTGRAELTLLGDFARIRAAVAGLARATLAGESDALDALDALGYHPFRRAAVVPPLLAALGVHDGAPACCLDASRLPPPLLASQEAEAAPAEPLFHRYCGTCHDTPDSSPPNFLHGTPAEVQVRLEHCAERIFYRLSLWSEDPDLRPKTAMPPDQALRRQGLDPARWPGHPDLDLLRGQAAELLRAETGAQPARDAFLARDYESLRACLPPRPAIGSRP